MYMTSTTTSKSAAKGDARSMVGLRMKSDESIIGTLNGVIKAKIVRRLPAKMVRGRSVEHTRNTVQNGCWVWGGDNMLIEVNGSTHAERGEDEHAPAQGRKKCDTGPTVAVPYPTVRRLYMTTSHIR